MTITSLLRFLIGHEICERKAWLLGKENVVKIALHQRKFYRMIAGKE